MAAIEEIRVLEERADDAWEKLLSASNSPNKTRTLRPLAFKEVSELLGKTQQTIRAAETAGRIQPIPRDSKGARHFTMEQALNLASELKLPHPGKAADERAVVVPISSQKGGSGKSTICLSLAHALALKRYRVLLIDLDPQATLTAMHGLIPARDVPLSSTVYPSIMHGDPPLSSAIRGTHWPTIDMIPSTTGLSDVDVKVLGQIASNPLAYAPHKRLARAVEPLLRSYDVVLVDCPPSFSLLTLNALYAADGVLSPVSPSLIDLASHQVYLSMVREFLEAAPEKKIGFLRMVLNHYTGSNERVSEMVDLYRLVYGPALLTATLISNAEVEIAAQAAMTIYEIEKPATNQKAYEQGIEMYEALTIELIRYFNRFWPSKSEPRL